MLPDRKKGYIKFTKSPIPVSGSSNLFHMALGNFIIPIFQMENAPMETNGRFL